MLINEKSKIKKLNTFLNGNFDISKLKNSVKLNCGTFGCVYKIDEKYCIKISKISNKHLSEIISNCDFHLLNNFISNIYEIGKLQIDEKVYYYMIIEYIDGVPLADIELNNYQIIDLLIFLIKFLYILHSNNLNYTDIKPENIMLTKNNVFKIVDVDTIIRLFLYRNTDKEIYTRKYAMQPLSYITTHHLTIINSCILLCLEKMNLFPNCGVKDYLSRKTSYVNRMIEIVNKFNITSPMQLQDPQFFHNVLMDLTKMSNNMAYSLLFLLNIYNELIPKFITSYINVDFVINILNYYKKYINKYTSEDTIEFCSSNKQDHILINRTNVDEKLLQNMADTYNKIPSFINVENYEKNIYPIYKKLFDNKTKIQRRFGAMEKIKYHIIDDEYYLLRMDPLTLSKFGLYI